MFIVNVEGAVWKNGQWLIIQRSFKEEHAGGMLSLAGGKVEGDNAAIDVLEKTVKREVFEEVGIKVKDRVEYVHSSLFHTDQGEPVVNIVFLCECEAGTPFPKSPDEVENVQWMTAEQILNHPSAPEYLKTSIRLALAKKQSEYRIKEPSCNLDRSRRTNNNFFKILF